MALSDQQKKVLAIVPKPMAILSMIGSGFIITEVLKDPKKRVMTYHRLLLAMSCVDILSSFWFFMSTWPIPEDTPDVYAASGTQGSCTTQGFFIQFNSASPLLNAGLSVYYLLVMRYKWTEDRLRKTVQPILLSVPLLWGMGTAFAGLGLDLYNSANNWCWIAAYPPGCQGDECMRGKDDDDTDMYRWVLFYCPLWFAIFFATVVMAIVYWTVARTPDEDFDAAPLGIFWFLKKEEGGETTKIRSRRVAKQAFWYLLAFYTTWIFPSIVRAMQAADADIGFRLRLLFTIFAPLQGLLNSLVYIRPRFSRNREKNPGISIFQALAVKDEQDHQLGAFRMRSTIKPAALVAAALVEDDDSGQGTMEEERKVDEAA